MRVCTVKLVGRSAGNVLWRAVKREEGTWSKISSWYRRQWDSSPPLPPYYHVCQIGDPVLRHEACSLTPGDVRSARVQQVIRRLREVLHKYNAVGLSAPQIGVPLKIFVVEFAKSRKNEFSPETYNLREMSTIPLKVFVNPEVKVVDYEKVVFPEACESVRGFHADVPRYRAVVVSEWCASSGGEQAGMVGQWLVRGGAPQASVVPAWLHSRTERDGRACIVGGVRVGSAHRAARSRPPARAALHRRHAALYADL